MGNSIQRLDFRSGKLCQITKTLSCGCMIGTAILFPVANDEALWFRFATLSIFIISTLAFTGLHIDSFPRYGVFTALLLVVLLVLALLSAGSSRNELKPWLPLFAALWGLITVAIHQFFQRCGSRGRAVSLEDGESDVPIGTLSRHSTGPGSFSDRGEARPPSDSSRLGSVVFLVPGHSRTPTQYSGDSELGLSDVAPRCQPDWDLPTQSFFATGGDQADSYLPGYSRTEDTTRSESEVDLTSESPSLGSNQPLLGPQ